jgi:hypothetical protein
MSEVVVLEAINKILAFKNLIQYRSKEILKDLKRSFKNLIQYRSKETCVAEGLNF